MIAKSDQWIDIDIDVYLANFHEHLDGLIMTRPANDPKWSFLRIDVETGLVSEIVEKVVISNEATTGIYNFINGSDFVTGAEDMIAKNMRSKGEFYVSTVYTNLIARGQKIGSYNFGESGTPEDLNLFV